MISPTLILCIVLLITQGVQAWWFHPMDYHPSLPYGHPSIDGYPPRYRYPSRYRNPSRYRYPPRYRNPPRYRSPWRYPPSIYDHPPYYGPYLPYHFGGKFG
ncbi:unnamed protein product [Onchocerca flexuosa]|uniref:Sulfur globule protein CV3 domain protein n=1 Tax=Onchocerca flexuosa TaxID=387005 RepID=A0A183I557_9BILA|nr:unnamed protein product [Onchocerca flexuosa]